jgi:hypothetical protein
VPSAGGLLIVGSAFLGLVGIVGIGVGISYAVKPDPTLRLPMPKPTFLLPPPPEVGADYTTVQPLGRLRQRLTLLPVVALTLPAFHRLSLPILPPVANR